MKLRCAGALLLASLVAAGAMGAIAIVRSDEAMIRTAPAIVSGTAVEVYPRYNERGDIETVTRLLVDEALKGDIPAGQILEVVQFGGAIGDRFQAQSGAPTYQTGTRYLVFLDRDGRGNWTTFDLALGQFRFSVREGRQRLSRDTHEIAGWTDAGEDFRDFDRPAALFLALVHSVVAGVAPPKSVAAELHVAPLVNDFDVKSVTQTAIGSWAGAESPMNDNVSSTPASGDTKTLSDCEMRVIADDPHGDVSGSCCPGVVATAFFGCGCGSSACGSTVQNSETYRNIDTMDVVINDGVSTGSISLGNFVTTMVHEIGHTWGFRHSDQNASNGACSAPLACDSSAVMNHSIVNGLNGALQSWDRDAANMVYGNATRQPSHPGSQYVYAFDLPARRPAGTSWRISQAPCNPPGVPTVSANPSTISQGASSQLSASATGTNPTFTWFTGSPGNTSNQVGTGATINVSPSTTTSYWVRASACSQTADSATSVTVTVQCTAPTQATATANPTNVVTGGTSNISVAANGSGTLSYQLMQGNPPSGTTVGSPTTSSTLATPPLSSTTNFYVDVTNSCGRVSSNAVTVTVTPCTPPSSATASAQPQSIVAGNTTQLSVSTPNGTAPFNIQWFSGFPPGGSAITGANSATVFQSPNVTTTYYAQVTNACGGPINSTAVTVTVASACTPPSNAVASATPGSIQAGQTANLSVTANGTGLTIQWFTGTPPSGAAIPGATAATVPVTPAVTTTYFARVTGQCGTPSQIDSNTVTVTVAAACVDPSITTQPASQTIITGTKATLKVVAAGTAPLHYQWFEGASGDTSKPVGTDSTSFTTAALTKKTLFWVQVRGNCTGDKRANSATATIDVNPPRGRPVTH